MKVRSGSPTDPSSPEQERQVQHSIAVLMQLRQLALQLLELHETGVFHGCLTSLPESKDLDLNSEPVPEQIQIGGAQDSWDRCPPVLRRLDPLTLPTRIAKAREVLKSVGCGFDPRLIDLYQLGSLLAQRLSGEEIKSYLSSPQCKARLLPPLQLLVDRTLGQSSRSSITTLQAFVEELENTRQAFRGDHDHPQVTPDTAAVIEGSSSVDTDHENSAKRRIEKSTQRGRLPFKNLAHYKVVERVGRGGMGDVYLGIDPQLDRPVALKVLPEEFCRDESFTARFRHEAASAARLAHPNIVQIYFAGEDQGHLFFAMQYVEGESLSELLERRGRLDTAQCLEVLICALDGLSHAHRNAMVHRDIKPGNLLVGHKLRRVLLGDFGLVKSSLGDSGFTATGTVMGTAEYLSPEQGQGLPVDHRSDIYSLGVVAYQMLCGRLPFHADTPSAMIYQHVYQEPAPLQQFDQSIPTSLSNIVSRLLAKDPTDRYSDAEEVLDELTDLKQMFGSGISLYEPTVTQLSTGNLHSVSTADYPKTEVVRAPKFGGEPAVPDLELLKVDDQRSGQGFWSRLFGFARKPIRYRAEEAEHTQQLVEGAVREYERRQQRLAKLVGTAAKALNELEDLRESWGRAELLANQRATANEDEELAQEARAERDRCRSAIAELTEEIAQQQNEIEDMNLRLSQVNAKLEQLRSQRDLLNARLEVARAQAQILGGSRKQATSPLLKLSATGAAVVAWAFSLWFLNKALTPPKREKMLPIGHVEPPPSNPGERGRFQSKSFMEEIALGIQVSKFEFANVGSTPYAIYFVAGGVDGTVYKASYEKGDRESLRLVKFQGHRKPITALAHSSDNEQLASGDESGEIRVWDRKSNQNPLRRLLTGHTREILHLRFNQDGTQLLSVGADRTIRLWDVVREREVRKHTLERSMDMLALIHTGDQIITGAGLANPNAFGVWGGEVAENFEFTENVLTSFTFSFDRPEIAAKVQAGEHTADYRHLKVLPYNEQPQRVQTIGEDVVLSALTPDNRHAVVGTSSGSLFVWDMTTGERTHSLLDRSTWEYKLPSSLGFRHISISSDGSHAATITNDNGLQLWQLPDLRSPPSPHELNRFDVPQGVEQLSYLPDKKSFVAACGDGIQVWDASTHVLRQTEILYDTPVSSVLPLRDGATFAIASGPQGGTDPHLSFLRLPTPWAWHDSNVNTAQRFFGHEDKVTGLAIHENRGALISGSRDGTLRLWDTSTGEEQQRTDVGAPVNFISLSPNQKTLLVAADDSLLRVYDASLLKETQRLEGHTDSITCVRWSPNGSHFVSASRDRTLRVWQKDLPDAVHTLTGHEDSVNSAAILNFGFYVVSGSDDQTVRVWDTRSGSIVATFEGHAGSVLAVDLDSTGARAISTGSDNTIRVWNLSTAMTTSKLSD